MDLVRISAAAHRITCKRFGVSYKVGKGLPEIETEGKNKLDNPHFSSWLNEPELRNISSEQTKAWPE